MPFGFTGAYAKEGAVSGLPDVLRGLSSTYAMGATPWMSDVFSDWSNDVAIEGFVDGCRGSCHAQVEAPALEMQSCSEEYHSVDYLRFKHKVHATAHNMSIHSVAFLVNVGFFPMINKKLLTLLWLTKMTQHARAFSQ